MAEEAAGGRSASTLVVLSTGFSVQERSQRGRRLEVMEKLLEETTLHVTVGDNRSLNMDRLPQLRGDAQSTNLLFNHRKMLRLHLDTKLNKQYVIHVPDFSSC